MKTILSHIFLPVALMSSLSGCCTKSTPLLQATWYLQEKPTESKTKDQIPTDQKCKEQIPKEQIPTLYIALLNRSSQEQKISNLILNRTGRALSKGWQWHSLDNNVDPAVPPPTWQPAILAPGKLLVVEVNEFRMGNSAEGELWPKCMLPVDIVVLFSGNGSTNLDVAGKMPSALPIGWETCPVFPP
ncbi:hypothetical protein [Undibacterium sp.]|uniref:hypothetical protein n=1 Tax=Undibacterium sp. TaxID=1914977 RepID=UPI0025F5A197|nr:hypothetical protein [Undibacterium sp.]